MFRGIFPVVTHRGPTDRRTERPCYTGARTHLKRKKEREKEKERERDRKTRRYTRADGHECATSTNENL